MFYQKNAVVTIGDYGATVVFYQNSKIKDKIFLDEFNDKSKAELKTVFAKHKSALIYLLLDTIDQNYKKKVYPLIRKSDLVKLIRRDLALEGSKESFKNFIILNSKKSLANNIKSTSPKKVECMFVSAANSEIIGKWTDFLLELPNRFIGIYMVPVETFSFFKKLKSDIKEKSKLRSKKNNLCCFIMQNKTSGIRQIVFSENGIVFTRAVNYDFNKPDFSEKYEQDIYSTFEYLKRLFPDISISEVEIVNIFPAEILQTIKQISNVEINFVNYTPFEAASKIKENNSFPENSKFCDLLTSKIFNKEQKVLKFSTTKINYLERFFLALKSSYYLNLVLILCFLSVLVITIFARKDLNDLIEESESRKVFAMQELSTLQRAATKGIELAKGSETEDADISKITDFGKMEETFGGYETNFVDSYAKFKFLKNFNIKLKSFSYSLNNFNQKSPTRTSYKINIAGDLVNKSGDIEDLFREFDNLSAEMKKNLGQDQIKYPELPKNIDFNQKYYSFPVDFTISK